MSYGTSQAAFLNVLAGADAVVAQAIVRLTTLMQVNSAVERAWQAAYDKAVADGEADPKAVADEAVPAMTSEQDAEILNGESDGEDIVGNESPVEAPVDPVGDMLDEYGIPGLSEYLEEIGGSILDPTTDPESQYDINTEKLLYPDRENYPRLTIVIPRSASQDSETKIYDIVWGSAEDEEEEDLDPRSKNLPEPEHITDPYIRTPADYRLDPGGVKTRAFARKYGHLGITAVEGEEGEWGYEVPDDGTGGKWVGGHWEEPEDRPYGERRYVPGYFEASTDSLDVNEVGLWDRALAGKKGPTYQESDVLDMISNMSTMKIIEFQQLAADAGFYGTSGRADIQGHMSTDDQNILYTAMGQANVSGEEVWPMMELFAAGGKAAKTGTARVKEPFSVPAHLRSIPGEKTVAQETKARFRQQIGREMRPEELSSVAAELAGYYTKSNQEEIALYLAAYNGDNQGLLTGAEMQRIEEPGAATSFDIGETWANEIDLNKRRESNADSFKRMLSATMGNRPSVGNLTAAGGVQMIGRQ